jgi:UDP-N-acetyl-D-mannosaminuronic acid transferase (WecB/TagA/CpsF family)
MRGESVPAGQTALERIATAAEALPHHELTMTQDSKYRRILGVNFFIGDAPEAVEIGARGGLVVVPAAPALMELQRDAEYRRALMGADLAITDSSYLVLLWRWLGRERIHRVSGLEYLRLLLLRADFQTPGAVLWVMPSETSRDRNLAWLRTNGHPFDATDCYRAPKYGSGPMTDEKLLELIHAREPRHIVICVGGGTQEKLGLYIKENVAGRPAIHCIGAAIGFLSGDQVRIPHWADQLMLGWLFRCFSNPRRFVPRYLKAFELALLLRRYRHRLPELLN